MNYKVGDRVKKIASNGEGLVEIPLGTVGTIAGSGISRTWKILWDGFPDSQSREGKGWSAYSYQLAPLTDPKADAFLEGIRKWKPYEEPKHIEEFGTFTRETWERLKAKP